MTAIIIILAFLLAVSLFANLITIVVAWKTDKWNERLEYKRIINNARRKIQSRKYRAFAKQYDLLVEDYEKMERQPRITKKENGVMTISEPFLNDIDLSSLKSGDIIVADKKLFPIRIRK
jgi:hypothetical protein